MRSEDVIAVVLQALHGWHCTAGPALAGGRGHTRLASEGRLCGPMMQGGPADVDRSSTGRRCPKSRSGGASPLPGEATAMLRAATPGVPRRASEGRLCGPKMHGKSGTALSDGLADEILPAPGEATAALRTWVQGLPDTDAF